MTTAAGGCQLRGRPGPQAAMAMIVTLTTDFGTSGSYVAEMKGAGLQIEPDVRYVDVTHEVPPQDVRYAAFLIRQTLPRFPPRTAHVVVVDPGVGTARRILCFQVRNQFLIGPDNGVLSWAVRTAGDEPVQCRAVTNRAWFRPQVTCTFHGRDIMVPVAVRLAAGHRYEEVGPVCEQWVELPWPEPTGLDREVYGEVVFRDPFGNLITNIDRCRLPGNGRQKGYAVRVGNASARWVRTYGDASPGDLVALIGSSDLVEIAVVQGSAADRLQAGPGTPVTVTVTERGD